MRRFHWERCYNSNRHSEERRVYTRRFLFFYPRVCCDLVRIMASKIKVKRPQPFNKQAFTTQLVSGAKDIASSVRKDFEKTASTWTNKPSFNALVESTASRIVIHWTVNDPVADGKRWGYLDKGTRVRHAVMSRDWQSKTKPSIGGGAGVHLSSGAGRGRRVFVSRRIRRPGIQARGWTKAITEKWQRSIAADMEKHLRKAVEASGHAKGGKRR